MGIYRDYDQATLDYIINPRSVAPHMEVYQEQTRLLSTQAKQRIPHEADIAYGPDSDERLDFFPAARQSPTPVLIFCHGGGWVSGSKENGALLASLTVPNGIALVTLDYAQVPKQTIADMAAQIRRAIAWVYRNAARFGADPAAIHIAGHSSGAHLAAMMLADEWQISLDLPPDVIKSGVLLAGLYDMEAVRLSYRNRVLQLAAARELSPIRRLGYPRPLTLVYGTADTVEFRRQTFDLAAAAAANGYPVATFALPGCHHFNLVAKLAAGDTLAARHVLAQIGAVPAPSPATWLG